MKIGIISDTHGSLERWELAYKKYFAQTEMILHAGDVLYHGPRNPVLADYAAKDLSEALNSCPVPLICARGNCDADVDASVLKMPLQSPYAFVEINGKRILLAHGDKNLTPESKVAAAQAVKADIFISGHTHIAMLEEWYGVILLNPGSPSLSKRADGRSTIAMMDEEKIQVIDLDSDEILAEMPLA